MSTYGRWILECVRNELVRLVVTGKITNSERRAMECKLIAQLLRDESI